MHHSGRPLAAEPLIGVSGRRKLAAKIEGTADPFKHLQGDWFYADCAEAVIEAGGLPVNISLDVDPDKLVARLDGILLSGGTDIGPRFYGADPEPETVVVEEERDEFELALVAAAKAHEVPILGICRGLQVINVEAGGTLLQHVPEHERYDLPIGELTHEVTFVEGSALSSMYGPSLMVNSLHHQAADRIGDQLEVTATDGSAIEGLEHRALPIVAVQWHPEWLETRLTDPLFRWLIDNASVKARSGSLR